MGILCIV